MPEGRGWNGEKHIVEMHMEKNKNLSSAARELRKNATKEENLLWFRFLRKYPVRFHRQYVIKNYIVDFYCHKAKLVIELDGSQHYEPAGQAKDQARTEELNSMGLKVIRFSNRDILQRFASVCEAIHLAVNENI